MLLHAGRKKFWTPGIVTGKAAAGGGGGTTTFDGVNISSHISLSGGNLIATAGAGAGNASIARSVASHSTGKFYCEITSTSNRSGFDAVGICNSSFTIDGGTFLGNNSSSAALYSDGSNFGVGIAMPGGWTTGDVIGIAVDLGSSLMWIRKNAGIWNNNASFDPATNVGGEAFTVTGPIFFAVEMESSGDVFTANFGGSSYANTAPSGFGNW